MKHSDLEQAHLFARRTFDVSALMKEHPPRLSHPNKKIVYDLACPKGVRHEGTLVVSRWRAIPLPATIPNSEPGRVMREDVFGYEPTLPGQTPPVIEWYVNFADINLFVAYGSPLFAQDEMQVAEHPVLGSLKEALKAKGGTELQPKTRDGDTPAPFLIRGAPRRCSIATDPDPLEHRPFGLYGNRFAKATEVALRKAVTVLDPPTFTNLIAMEALPGGSGMYNRGQIEDLLVTATTGFQAAVIESANVAKDARTIVHTGHWGAGAYGGNRVLMAIVQTVAARLAGLAGLVYHTFDADGSDAWRTAMKLLDTELLPKGRLLATNELVQAITEKGFTWGTSDGN